MLEQIEKERMHIMSRAQRRRYSSQLMWGAVLLLVGTAMLLENLDLVQLGPIWRHWPALLVALGIGKLIQADETGEYISAFWLIFLGAWFYVSLFHFFGLGFHDSWPLLLVGLGGSMVLRSTLVSHRQQQGESV